MHQVGTRYGMVVVTELAVARSLNRGSILDMARCDCGIEKAILRQNLTRGKAKSCGCQFRTKPKHGQCKSRTYQTWTSMISRCKDLSCAVYGGRGIAVCSRWATFENFLADMGARPPGKTLDRIDNDAGYTPENCRWSTPAEQTNNRRVNIMVTIDGETLPLGVWADRLGLNRYTVYSRYELNQDAYKSLGLTERQ